MAVTCTTLEGALHMDRDVYMQGITHTLAYISLLYFPTATPAPSYPKT